MAVSVAVSRAELVGPYFDVEVCPAWDSGRVFPSATPAANSVANDLIPSCQSGDERRYDACRSR